MIGILLAIANAKSGITWALNVATVEIIWFVTSGPGSIDGNKISILPCTLFIKAQSLMENFFLILGGNVRLCYSTSKPATFGDAIVAIDILEILWQTANPTQAGGWDPVSYSNGVV
ncbi:hypothetical protein RirG_032330 [Rhizophagus irregularis DAOM 197198w]|uniref:Uncharacterized protein n=1 Tax=Rhizophagus irregularis (strain DAOM 197198w) TaxID=1432141 RepID=A0A015L9Z7_RHIIW|nr:hypothetical protein RirG_032330 [Rhizophagus irregularis DAOM 197198w]